jgi:dipeptidyl aminopeptidase/acylaminoacyl peptidase
MSADSYRATGSRSSGSGQAARNGAAKHFVIVHNRGGFRDIGKIDSWNLIDFHGFASQGFVVLASQYRGNDGGEGRDEVGGADVADVMALMQLARRLPYADADNVFCTGFTRRHDVVSRAQTGLPAKATPPSAPCSIRSNEPPRAGDGEDGHGGQRRFRPRRRGGLRARSVTNWPEQIGVPLLIIHGANDQKCRGSAMAFATRLAELRKRYQLIVCG